MFYFTHFDILGSNHCSNSHTNNISAFRKIMLYYGMSVRQMFSCPFHTHIVKRLPWTHWQQALHFTHPWVRVSWGVGASWGHIPSISPVLGTRDPPPFPDATERSCVCVLVAQLCPPLGDPTDCSLPGSSVHGILQARILEWLAMPFPRGSFWLRDRPWVSHTAGGFFTIWATREAKRSYTVFNLSFSDWNVHLSYLMQKYCIQCHTRKRNLNMKLISESIGS